MCQMLGMLDWTTFQAPHVGAKGWLASVALGSVEVAVMSIHVVRAPCREPDVMHVEWNIFQGTGDGVRRWLVSIGPDSLA